MEIRFFKASCLTGVLFFFFLKSSVLGSPNVIAWEAGTGFGIGQYGETNVPPDLTNAVAIAAGGFHSLALRNDGTVVAWGRNSEGETNVPTGLSNVVAVAAGYYHSIALKADGTIVVWGDNSFGQTSVPAGLSNIVAVAGSYYDTIVLNSDGTVLAWGGSNYGQTNIPAGLSNVVAVSAGFYDNMVLKSDGTVVAWGGGVSSVTNVPADLTNAVAITCSMSISVENSLALRSDGTVTSWGYTQAGVPSDLTNVFSIAAGGVAYASPAVSRDLALKADGSLVGWGTVTNLPSNQSNITAIACGEAHELALIGNSLPIQHAQITNPSLSGTNFSVQVPTQNGRVYSLEFKNSLNDPNWTALPLVAGVDGISILKDSTSTHSQRFYRVQRW
jgi:alpha-tubulin suppressor-like RCC1 family protein